MEAIADIKSAVNNNTAAFAEPVNSEDKILDLKSYNRVRETFNDGAASLFDIGKRTDYEKQIIKGDIKPKDASIFLYGFADETIKNYFYSIDDRIKSINSIMFSFSTNKRLREAEHLNNLGAAEQIFSNPAEYLKDKLYMTLTFNALQEIREETQKIENEINPTYLTIHNKILISKGKMKIIANNLFEEYAGCDLKGGSKRASWQNEYIQERFQFLKAAAEAPAKNNMFSQGKSEMQFPYASEFLQRHVFLPMRDYKNRNNLQPVYISFGNR